MEARTPRAAIDRARFVLIAFVRENRRVRQRSVGLALSALLTIALACSQPTPQPSPAAPPPSGDDNRPLPDPLPAIVAQVDDKVIPFVPLRILAEKRLRESQAKNDDRARIYRQALNELIDRELLLEEAIARGVRADERLVERAYDELRSQSASDEIWRQSLARDGLTPEILRAELRVQRTIEALLARVNAEARADSIAEQEIREFYETNPRLFDTGEQREVAHILVRVPPGSSAAQKNDAHRKIKRLRERVDQGEDFAAVARAESEDPSSRDRGGKLPPFGQHQMITSFAMAAFALKPNQISDIVETPVGYHVIRLDRTLPSRHISLAEVHDNLTKHLLEERRARALARLTEKLRSRARIKVLI